MREYYPKIVIDGDGGRSQRWFANALRFSTHADYFLRDDFHRSVDFSTAHFFTLENARIGTFDFKFDFADDNFVINEGLSIVPGESLFRVPSRYRFRHIDFIIGPALDFVYVGGLLDDGSMLTKPAKKMSLEFFGNVGDYFSPGDVLSITRNSENDSLEIFVNKFFNRWEGYRAIGINIALLVIQVLLGRNVISLPLIDSSKILVKANEDYKSSRIALPKVVWFDLDETLVCKWKPIVEMCSLLKACATHGHTVKLITRHKYKVSETLEKIGLASNTFSEIKVVKDVEKKSDFLDDGDAFIDNEFSERRDVVMNRDCIVFDLDQVDFMTVGDF